jgi:hypothetical protein
MRFLAPPPPPPGPDRRLRSRKFRLSRARISVMTSRPPEIVRPTASVAAFFLIRFIPSDSGGPLQLRLLWVGKNLERTRLKRPRVHFFVRLLPLRRFASLPPAPVRCAPATPACAAPSRRSGSEHARSAVRGSSPADASGWSGASFRSSAAAGTCYESRAQSRLPTRPRRPRGPMVGQPRHRHRLLPLTLARTLGTIDFWKGARNVCFIDIRLGIRGTPRHV